MIKLAIHGLKESGKTTCAEYYNTVYGIDIFAFAYHLKLDLINMGVPAEVIKAKPWPMWLRVLAQMYGMSKRIIDPKYWISKCLADVYDSESEGVVIEDLRFYNEAIACKQDGFVTIKVVKTGQINDDDHPSENDLEDYEFDYVVEATEGDLAGLFEQLDEIIAEVER